EQAAGVVAVDGACATWRDGLGDASGVVANRLGGVAGRVGHADQIAARVVAVAQGHALGIDHLLEQAVVPGQLGSTACRIDDDRRRTVGFCRVFVFDDAAGSGHHGGHTVGLVVAVGDVCAFGGHRADFAAAGIVGVNGDLAVARRRRHNIAVRVIGHGLAVALGIDDSDDATFAVGDPRVGPGAVIGGDRGDAAAQIRIAYAAAVRGQLADHAL